MHPNPEDLARLFDLSIDMLCIAGDDGYFKRVNPAFEAVLGHTTAELLAKPFFEFVHEDDRGNTVAAFQALLDGRRVIDFENRYRCADGSYRWLSWRSAPATDGNIYAVARDVSENKATQNQLRVSEERFRQFADNAQDAFWIFDIGPERFTFVNPAFERIFGIEPARLYEDHSLWSSAIFTDDRERVRAAFADWRSSGAARPLSIQYRVNQPDGEIRHVEDCAFPIVDQHGSLYRIAGVATDVTERHVLEERLFQSQKMEAVGRLAGGVAHEFNNFLTSILGNLEFVQEAVATNADRGAVLRDVERIDAVARRAASLTRQLLTLSSRRVVQPTVFDLNRLVLDSEMVLSRLIPDNIELKSSVPDRPSYVLAGPPQIQQVIMNLVVNAKDAMPNGGKLSLRVDHADVDAAMVARMPDLALGPYVRLTVSDTGCGMDEETVGRVFEPFYTTKPAGAGTGLGMAIVHGIVKQSRGAITVQSRVQQGSTFEIHLPLVQPAKPAQTASRDEGVLTGRETILVCEDDAEVRHLVCTVLERNGYQVHAADDPLAALLMARSLVQIDLLLTDVIMPTMSGVRLAERLKEHHDRTRVIYMSGYTADELDHHGVVEQSVALLEKPFSPAALLHRVRTTLDGPLVGARTAPT